MMQERSTASGRGVVCFLVVLVLALPVITGVLVWKLTPACDEPEPEPQQQTTPTPTTPDPNGDGPWQNIRLPDSILPVHYDLTLFPDFYGDEDTFYGNMTLEAKVLKRTRYVMVHVLFLNISECTLTDNVQQPVGTQRMFESKPNQFYVVETTRPLPANSTVYLHMTFSGSLTRAIVGFYKSTYTNFKTSKRSSIATTKFEPVNARRAYPCMDEPSLKATYTVTLIHRPGYTALSNMPPTSTVTWENNGSLQKTSFQKSTKMSTYLACFIVCDFHHLNKTSNAGVQVRLWAPPDRVSQTQYALEVAVTAVDLYTNKFNISYPLPKLDLISVPDFPSGAMENWGLITFRETNILYDPLQASARNQQRVTTVVTHEVAHQWFGNLVTMAWWDDLWLNEGFASFIEYIGADKHQPKWNMNSQFLSDDLQPVMVMDASLSSHPIVVHLTRPSEINSVFDSISYSKGASVIRMLSRWMGEDAFFAGISRYLRQYKYMNAQTDDLWRELGNITKDLSVSDVMDTWTKQTGLPVVTLNISGSTVTATQSRFLADSSMTYDKNRSPYGFQWYIKLDYKTSQSTNGSVWIEQQPAVTFNVAGLEQAGAWLKCNLDETGFYRVNYDEGMWARLSTLLRCDTRKLSPSDRSNLLDDAFNLARAGLLEYDVALNMTSYLHLESDYLPWDSAAGGLAYISSMMEFTGDYSVLQEYLVERVYDQYDRLGWNDTGSSHLDTFLRSIVVSLACANGHEPCLDNATVLFQDWLYRNVSISPNLRSLVYTYGMQASRSSGDWEAVWQRYQNEADVQEQAKLRSALAKTTSIPLLMKYIELAQDEKNIRSQDYFTVLTYIARNPVGRSLVWDWVRNNWMYLVNRFGVFHRLFGRVVPSIVSNFNTEYQLEEVRTFFQKYPDAGSGAAGRRHALESIERNIRWMKNNRHAIVTWLMSRGTTPQCY